MFYRIRENKIYDYADYKYADDCLYSDLCTMAEYEQNKDNYTCENGIPEVIPNLEEVIVQRKRIQFEKDFFSTSLGWIRRKVKMKNGSVKDFLSDLLLQIKAGIELGQTVEIITYKTPDFTLDLTEEYILSLQERKIPDLNFIRECLEQTVNDFGI